MNKEWSELNKTMQAQIKKYRYGKKAGDKGVSKIGGRGQWLLK